MQDTLHLLPVILCQRYMSTLSPEVCKHHFQEVPPQSTNHKQRRRDDAEDDDIHEDVVGGARWLQQGHSVNFYGAI